MGVILLVALIRYITDYLSLVQVILEIDPLSQYDENDKNEFFLYYGVIILPHCNMKNEYCNSSISVCILSMQNEMSIIWN